MSNENMTKTIEHSEMVDSSHHHENMPFYAGAEFWVFVAFALVVALLYKKVKSGFVSAMKLHAEKIRDKLSETRNIRDETQAELVKCQKKLKDVQNEISIIISKSGEEANRYKHSAKHDYMENLKFREEKLKERIHLDELELKRRIKNALIETSLAALTTLLSTNKVDDSVLIHNTIIEFSESLKHEAKF